MISTAQAKRIRPIGVAFLRTTSIAIVGALALFGSAFGGQDKVQRSRVPDAGSEWEADVLKEWERYGSRSFKSVPADQPHAILHLKNTVQQSTYVQIVPFALIDGELVVDWSKSSPLRLSPGPHCIRVDIVVTKQRFERNFAKGELWYKNGDEDEGHLSGSVYGSVAFNYKKIKATLKLEDLINEEEIKYSRNRPEDPKAAYDYCLKYVHERRSR